MPACSSYILMWSFLFLYIHTCWGLRAGAKPFPVPVSAATLVSLADYLFFSEMLHACCSSFMKCIFVYAVNNKQYMAPLAPRGELIYCGVLNGTVTHQDDWYGDLGDHIILGVLWWAWSLCSSGECIDVGGITGALINFMWWTFTFIHMLHSLFTVYHPKQWFINSSQGNGFSLLKDWIELFKDVIIFSSTHIVLFIFNFSNSHIILFFWRYFSVLTYSKTW